MRAGSVLGVVACVAAFGGSAPPRVGLTLHAKLSRRERRAAEHAGGVAVKKAPARAPARGRALS